MTFGVFVKSVGRTLYSSMDIIMFSIISFVVLILITTALGQFTLDTLVDLSFWFEWLTIVLLGTVGHHVFGNSGARKKRNTKKFRDALKNQVKGFRIISSSNKSKVFDEKITKEDEQRKIDVWRAEVDNKIHKWINVPFIMFIWKKRKLKYWKRNKELLEAYDKYMLHLIEDNLSEEELEELKSKVEEFNPNNIKINYPRIYKQLFTSNTSSDAVFANEMEFKLHKRLFDMSLGMKIFSLMYTFLSTTLIINYGGFTVEAKIKLAMYTFLVGWNCTTGMRNSEYLVEEEEISAINQREEYQKQFIIEEGLKPPTTEVN